MYINELSPELRDLAEEERERQISQKLIRRNCGRKLIQYFLWDESIRGKSFWEAINKT